MPVPLKRPAGGVDTLGMGKLGTRASLRRVGVLVAVLSLGLGVASTGGAAGWPRLVAGLTPYRLAAAATPAPAGSAPSSVSHGPALPSQQDNVTFLVRSAYPQASFAAALHARVLVARQRVLRQRHTPGIGADQAVTRWARAHGFAVTATAGLAVAVSGPANSLAAALGTTVFRQNGYLVPAAAPAVPAALRRDVASVVGLSTVPVMHSNVVVSHPRQAGGKQQPAVTSSPLTSAYGYLGEGLRTAYRTQTGSSLGQGMTIGVMEFSGWEPGDLSAFASEYNLPIGSNQVTTVYPDGTVANEGSDGGSLEVAADTETILSAAPLAHQRLYIAPNDSAGIVAEQEALNTDAANGTIQAISSSWGGCEFQNPNTAGTTDPYEQAVLAGATMFASSGDAGGGNCGAMTSGTTGVNYPASQPYVLAVGGTQLSPSATAGSYTESLWSRSSGGPSSYYQSQPAATTVSATSTRQVPDVTEIGEQVACYATYASGNASCGGTSMGPPVATALLADSLSYYGVTQGLGNIIPYVYAAPTSYFDPAPGSNGQYTAVAGQRYNVDSSGLGSPYWLALTQLILTGEGIVQPHTSNTSAYTTLATPQRLYDSRVGQTDALSGGGGTLVPGRDYQVAVRGPLNIPSGATAVALDVTAIQPGAGGNLRVFPDTDGAGTTTPPGATTTSYVPGQSTATFDIVALPADGAIDLATFGSPLNVALDVVGYWNSGYTAITPSRVFDSRVGQADAPAGGSGPLQAGQSVPVPLPLTAVPAGAATVTVAVTAISPASGGNLRAFADSSGNQSTAAPNAVTVSYQPGKTTTDLAVLQVPTDRDLLLETFGSTVNAVVDVIGYTTSTVIDATPASRILDTRSGTGGYQAPFQPGQVYPVTVSGAPSSAVAVLVTVGSVQPSAGGNLRVYPDTNGLGTTPPPGTSSLNYVPGAAIGNFAIVGLAPDGKLDSATFGSATNETIDVLGYVLP